MAAGDIMLDRGVRKKMEAQGEDYPLAAVSALLKSADLACANLEGAISADAQKTPKCYCFRADPTCVAMLKRAGFGVLSLANNHSMDCYQEGLGDTMDLLDAGSLPWFGARRAGQPARVAEVKVRGLRIAFAGFNDISPDIPSIRPGKPVVEFASEEAVRDTLEAVRPKADLLVASFHWGNEDTHEPTARQRALAQAAVDGGADLVLGHHPHVLQGFRSTVGPGGRKVLIAYSLGNFVFDQRREMQRESLILRCEVDRSGLRGAEVIPLRIRGFRPEVATEEEAAQTLAALAEWSKKEGGALEMARIRMVEAAPVAGVAVARPPSAAGRSAGGGARPTRGL
jgi:poly-gamma-glutamate synthesis protein (capsule biosynthesis protein)